MKLIIVSGLSGSGKTVALHALEDAGLYCIDNLPIPMLQTVVTELLGNRDIYQQDIAIGIDARTTTENLRALPEKIEQLRNSGVSCKILYLEADQRVLLQRFSETRRRHPLTKNNHSLNEAIIEEHTRLQPVREAADILLDTTRQKLHELRHLIRLKIADDSAEMQIHLQSFGFKYGLPQDAALVFDARFLPNPYWNTELRMLTGKDPAVHQFLSSNNNARELQHKITDLLQSWIPSFQDEGRAYLTIAIGCTGGQHRSVYLVEVIGKQLKQLGYDPVIQHRELEE
ncbi:MAG TPA: RNase adapter RapZ [Gammaproteobacteria bacterium]|nr:RNase adapter RapZ [Gammaproteobacteria bacterium]